MIKINRYIMLLSFIVLLVSFWQRNSFPDDMQFRSELKQEPEQQLVEMDSFEVEYKGTRYVIEPQYEYNLYGMVVSYRHHDGKSRMHQALNDHINMMDLCVVWSDTAFSGVLNEFNFWSGIFTCNYETKSKDAWSRFNPNQFSNNHLLSNDEYIRGRVNDVSIGDQIHVKGWLSSYNAKGSTNKRGTSIVRTDTGNGACETIFVEEFNIIQAVDSGWRKMMYVSLAVFFLSLIVYFKTPYRPYQ